jgi:hypothetical protein
MFEACCSLLAARRALGVKPIAINGAGHANIVTSIRLSFQTLVSEVFDGSQGSAVK